MLAMMGLLRSLCQCGQYEQAVSGGDEELEAPGLVTVLQGDGRVLEFPHTMVCSELLAQYPQHRVFPAGVLVGRPGKMVPEDAMLECGQIYTLLPKGTRMRMPFTVPKEYLAVLRGGDPPPLVQEPPARRNHQPRQKSNLKPPQEQSADAVQDAVLKRAPGPLGRNWSGTLSGPQAGPGSRVHNWSGPMSGPQSVPMSGPLSAPGAGARVHNWSGPMSGPLSGPLQSISELE